MNSALHRPTSISPCRYPVIKVPSRHYRLCPALSRRKVNGHWRLPRLVDPSLQKLKNILGRNLGLHMIPILLLDLIRECLYPPRRIIQSPHRLLDHIPQIPISTIVHHLCPLLLFHLQLMVTPNEVPDHLDIEKRKIPSLDSILPIDQSGLRSHYR